MKTVAPAIPEIQLTSEPMRRRRRTRESGRLWPGLGGDLAMGMLMLLLNLALVSSLVQAAPVQAAPVQAAPVQAGVVGTIALEMTALETMPQESAVADKAVEYRVSFPNRRHHEAEVTIHFPVHPEEVLSVRMSRSSPGRYRLHDFARNVYSVEARGADGEPLAISQPDPYGWTVESQGKAFEFTYTVFGDELSGTYSQIDETQVLLNPPSVLAFARGFEDRKIRIEVVPGEPNWRVETQLKTIGNGYLFEAPDLQYLLDSPIKAGVFEVRDWSAPLSPDSAETVDFRLAVDHLGDLETVETYAEMTRKVVAEAGGAFGEFPQFDHGIYRFMATYVPWGGGDAMEHRNSTPLTSSRPLEGNELALLETLSHEFIHAWNVERIRPQSLEPFDFEGPNVSEEMWIAEGLTNYYDGLFLKRAGLWTLDDYLDDLSSVIDDLLQTPATRLGGPVYMSRRAIFRDRGTWRDRQNANNTYFHYYKYGDALGIALDLELRSRFSSSLDDVFRKMWERYGRVETPYQGEDFQDVIASVSSEEFAQSFFDRFVDGNEMPDYEALLKTMGLRLELARPGSAWLGPLELRTSSGGLVVTESTVFGTPVYKAEVDRTHILKELAGQEMKTLTDWSQALEGLTIGERVQLLVADRATLAGGPERSVDITPIQDPTMRVVVDSEADPSALKLRESWLESRAFYSP